MKKLTEIINESYVSDDYIEDCLIHFQDMGFIIDCFDQVGGVKKSNLFTNGEVTKSNIHLYSFQPTDGNLFVCHAIRLKKKIHQFSDDYIWEKIVSEMNSFKRKLTRCDVYYSIGYGYNGLQNAESDLSVSIFIVDKSEKLNPVWVNKRKSIWSAIWGFLREDFHAERLSNFTYFNWTKDKLILNISLEKNVDNQRREKSIESLLNWIENDLIKKFSVKYNVSTENSNLSIEFSQ